MRRSGGKGAVKKTKKGENHTPYVEKRKKGMNMSDENSFEMNKYIFFILWKFKGKIIRIHLEIRCNLRLDSHKRWNVEGSRAGEGGGQVGGRARRRGGTHSSCRQTVFT